MKGILFFERLKTCLQVILLLAMLLFNFGYSGTKPAYAAAPSNDNFASATTITSVPYTKSINVTDATQQAGEPGNGLTCDGNDLLLSAKTVWFKYIPIKTGLISFDTTGSNYDTVLAIWQGTALNNLIIKDCDDDDFIGFTSHVSVNVTAGTTYYIQVGFYNGTYPGLPDNPSCSTTCDLVFHAKYQTFVDVPSNAFAWAQIEAIYAAGITGGCTAPPLNYCPNTVVSRAQMAVFLLRGIHGSTYSPPPVGASTGFGDVPTNYWAAAWIKQLAAENITGGCGNGNYCPETTVTRSQMAVFLLKAKYGSNYSPPVATGIFLDVPVGYWADRWVERLAAEGITSGCGSGKYCPEIAVTRAQMAVFIQRTFNFTLP